MTSYVVLHERHLEALIEAGVFTREEAERAKNDGWIVVSEYIPSGLLDRKKNRDAVTRAKGDG